MLKFNKKLNKQQASEKASHAANVRWERERVAKKGELPRCDYPDPLYTWPFVNHITGKEQLIAFHFLNHKSMEIRLNGKKWAIGGFNKAFELISSNCPKLQYHY